MLYIVATPIGNLKEITYRAVEVLSSVDYIACEDTRTSRVLLENYGIKKPLVSYHKFNESKATVDIINDLKQGKDVAIISDAGMPGISDPGNIIIKEAQKEDIGYTVVSGASATINAYVLSGFDTPFTFVGFLPENNNKLSELLDNLSKTKSTLIFYCSPHSLIDDLSVLYKHLGNRKICVVREISKKFEEKTFSTLADGYSGTVKGEFVVVVGESLEGQKQVDLDSNYQILIDMGLSKTDASKVLAKISGAKKSDIYKKLIEK